MFGYGALFGYKAVPGLDLVNWLLRCGYKYGADVMD